MLADIIITVLQILSTFYLTLVLLRFLLQLARADFYNPISQFVVKATNPPLKPLRRVIPGIGGLDGAAIVLALIVQSITFLLIMAAVGNGISSVDPLKLLSWSVVTVLSLIIKIYFWSVLAVVIISWVAPTSNHPAIALVVQITEPVMRPIRSVMPSLGGLDLSPIIVFLLLNVATVVVSHMAEAVGLGIIGVGL